MRDRIYVMDYANKSDRELIVSIHQEVEELKGYFLKEKEMDIQDVADYLGCSRALLYRDRWLMPNYGVSSFEGKTRWTLEEVEKWFKISAETRKRGWKTSQTQTQDGKSSTNHHEY